MRKRKLGFGEKRNMDKKGYANNSEQSNTELSMNIMISSNSNYLRHAMVMLYSLFLHHMQTQMDIYMPYSELTDLEVEELICFVQMFSGKKLIPIQIGKEFSQKVEAHNGISIETYYRILAIDVLPASIDKILYLDVDMVIAGSLESLYQRDIEGYPFVVCEDILGILNDFHEMNKYRMKIPAEYSYFNAGVMLFNLQYLRQTNAAVEIIERIYRNFERYEYNDQDVLNEMYYDKLLWADWSEYNLPPAIYYVNRDELNEGKVRFVGYEELKVAAQNPVMFKEHYLDASESMMKNAKVIHYMGAAKPWNRNRKDAAVYKMFDEPYFRYNFFVQNRIGEQGRFFQKHKSQIIKQILSVGYSYYYLKNRIKKAKITGQSKAWILGSSYAAQGVIDKDLGWMSNLSAPSQDLFCDREILRKLIAEKSPQATDIKCILMLGYYALYEDISRAGAKNADIMRLVYEPLIGHMHHYKAEPFDIRQELKNCFNYMNDGRIQECENWIDDFFDSNAYFNSIYTREGNDAAYRDVWETLQEKADIGRERAEKHNHLLTHREIKPENVEILYDLLEMLHENGIQVIIVIPPFTKYYLDNLSEKYREELLEVLEDYSFPIDYYDMNGLDVFEDGDFFDSDHLNDNGANKLTGILCEILQ